MKIPQETVGANSIPSQLLDLPISIGVLHHIPDTVLAIRKVASNSKVAEFSFVICITSSKINQFFTVSYFRFHTYYVW